MSETRKCRSWTVQQKLEIVLAGLRGDRSVAELCREHQISENLYYTWREKLLEGGKLALSPGWQSKDLVSPLAPIVVNGMMMAVSSGEHRGGTGTAAEHAKQSAPAVLYVLDAATGKEMWNSGKTITSFARAGMAAGGGQVYLVTYDNQLYAFGIPMEH